MMKIIIFFAFLFSINVVADEPEQPKVHLVSIINLIATPEKFDGKTVVVHGELFIALRGLSAPIWLSFSSKHFDRYSMVKLNIPHEHIDDLLKDHGKFYRVKGVFKSCAAPLVDGALCYLSITPNRIGPHQRLDMIFAED